MSEPHPVTYRVRQWRMVPLRLDAISCMALEFDTGIPARVWTLLAACNGVDGCALTWVDICE